MIVDKISNINQYTDLLPQLLLMEKFIGDHENDDTPDCGKYVIDGENVFALVQEYLTKESKDVKWETHREYIDVQFIAKGSEAIGYAPAETLSLKENFTVDNDIAFHNGPANYTNIVLSEGMFAIFFPEEGHLPCCIDGSATKVSKIVFKIKLR